jgi:predicted transcriptional regulator
MLTRLVEKQAVSESKQGHASVYDPLLSRRKARLSAFRSLAETAFDGAMGPLVHFLVEEEQLTAKQKEELVSLLQDETGDKGERK